MTITVRHAKTNTVPAWTQTDLNSAIAGSPPPIPSGTLIAGFTTSTDWNNDHVVTGSFDSVSRTITQSAHGFTAGQVLKFLTTYQLAQSDNTANAEAIGMVSNVMDANNFILTTYGYVTGLTGLAANTEYFLSPSSAGALTATAPSTIGQVNKPLFKADSTTSGYFINYRGYVLTSTTNPVMVGRASTLVTAFATGSTILPADNSIPQNTEGDQYMSLAYTPQNTANILIIRATALVASSASPVTPLTIALFQDSTANALAATAQMSVTGNGTVTIPLVYVMTAGTTSSTTFKVRIGPGSASTTSFNGAGGVQRYAGVGSSLITIEEYTV